VGTHRITFGKSLFSLLLATLIISAGSQAALPFQVTQSSAPTERPPIPQAQETPQGPVPGDTGEKSFLSGCSNLVLGNFQKARESFTNYLKHHQVRVDSDLDLANLIGLGLACEGLGDYRFAAGYFQLAANIGLDQWYLVNTPQECNFFGGQIYGFRRLEPFAGLVRLAVRANDLEEGFHWSEEIHFLKMLGWAACSEKGAGPEEPQPGGARRREARAAFGAVLNQMKAALEEHDRPLFLKLAARFRELRQEYPDYAKEVYQQPLRAGNIPLQPREALLEFLVTDERIFAFAVHNRRVIKNVVIPISREDLEVQVNRYLSSAAPGFTPAQTASYNPELGRELYALLLKDLLLPLPPVDRLIIIPDDGLWGLPFEILIRQAAGEDAAGQAQGREAGREAPAITYYPAATPLPPSLQEPK
jgi:hypothetical protein